MLDSNLLNSVSIVLHIMLPLANHNHYVLHIGQRFTSI